jgi:hypothetical protein
VKSRFNLICVRLQEEASRRQAEFLEGRQNPQVKMFNVTTSSTHLDEMCKWSTGHSQSEPLDVDRAFQLVISA